MLVVGLLQASQCGPVDGVESAAVHSHPPSKAPQAQDQPCPAADESVFGVCSPLEPLPGAGSASMKVGVAAGQIIRSAAAPPVGDASVPHDFAVEPCCLEFEPLQQ